MAGGLSYMKQCLRELDSEHITVRVGKNGDSRDFSLPKEMLCSRSRWFKSALQEDRFQEGINKTIELREDMPAVFELFVFYVHYESLILSYADEIHVETSTREDQLVLFANLWAFSDKYLLSDLRHCTMARVCRLFNDYFFAKSIANQTLATLFNAVRDESPIRTLVADHIVDRLEKKDPDLQIVAELAASPGFYRALHDSEAAFHSLPRQDFPRCRKPPKFAHLFHTGQSAEEKGDLDKYNIYSGHWNSLADDEHDCHDCGTRTSDWLPQCRACNKLHCACNNRRWKVICRDCSPRTSS